MTHLFPIEDFGSNCAFIDGDTGRRLSYADLGLLQKQLSERWVERSLIFLFCQNTLEEVAAYVAALNLAHVVCLLDARLSPELKQHAISLYQPRYILQSGSEAWPKYRQIDSPLATLSLWQASRPQPELHPELTLLLSTSGTTGSPKMIRLSPANLRSNALAIIDYLGIDAHEKAIASLPMHYSYGLSVINSHIFAGATLVLTQQSMTQAGFWAVMRQQGCTSFAGVPYTYQLLDRLGFERMELPQLKTMTQAGGHLDPALALHFWRVMQAKGGRFFVMYGQTEATARIAYLPPDLLPSKAGAIGRPIPGGSLAIVEGELIYRGPNVMLGYAETADDLAKGDEMQGVLATGDLGVCDSDGIFYVTGRVKRISKIYGYRINLDEIEHALRPIAVVAVTSDDIHIFLYFEEGDDALFGKCIHYLSEKYKLHPTTFIARNVKSLPRTPSGKIDYQKLGPTGPALR